MKKTDNLGQPSEASKIAELEAKLARAVEKIEELQQVNNDYKRRPRLGIVWEDQPEEVEADLKSKAVTLNEVKKLAVKPGDGEVEHLLIEGDNLHALTALQFSHRNKVDVCYIDPPYNTGNEFTYNDRIVGEEDEWRHSKWLSLMDKRLRLGKSLLKKEGVMLIAIDDCEQAHLKLLCDSIFGESNFIAQLIWQGGRKNNAKFVSSGHDYVLVYAKSKVTLVENGTMWRESKDGAGDVLKKAESIWAAVAGDAQEATNQLKAWFKSLNDAHPAKKHKHYNHIDSKGRVFFPGDLSAPGDNGPRYDVLHPVTGKPCQVPSRGWGYAEETMMENIANDRVHFGTDHARVPNRKTFLSETLSEVPESVFYTDRRAAKKQLTSILGKGKFDYPKDVGVLKRWLNVVAPSDAVVLDFFAGSGSTGHAVVELNAEDSGTRQAILVTNNENNICTEVTYPRLKAVLSGKWADKKTRSRLPGGLRYFKCGLAALPGSRGAALQKTAMNSLSLIGLKEGVHTVVESDRKNWSVLAEGDKVVISWNLWDDSGLYDLLELYSDFDTKVAYVLCEDSSLVEDLTEEFPNWRFELAPTKKPQSASGK